MKKKKGAALLVVVIIMMATFMLAAYMLDASVKSSKSALSTLNSTKAYYIAETGIYDFINYMKNKDCAVSRDLYLMNVYNSGGLYGDNMASYKTQLNSPISFSDVGNTRVCSFSLYSTGSYGDQVYIITADVYMNYVKNSYGLYVYSSYTINSKKLYKA
ncbi:hypothetical protein [Clostridium thermarum]|uniref:hypothetical protein n=1 Tax=Clostridium thermarum TaxID=1716543 RepID=UPI0011212056|nr:hypothetical protein [Clostridium thermarum]